MQSRKITIFLLIFLCIAINGCKEENKQELVTLTFNSINQNNDSISVNYEIVNGGTIYGRGKTEKNVYEKVQLPFGIYTLRFWNDLFYPRTLTKTLGENCKTEECKSNLIVKYYLGNPDLTTESTLNDDKLNLTISSINHTARIHLCFAWTPNIIDVNVQGIQTSIPKRLVNKVDKCIWLTKSLTDDQMFIEVELEKNIYNPITDDDYLRIYLVDQCYNDVWELSTENSDGSDNGIKDEFFIIKN